MLAKSLIERRDNIKMTIAALEERQRAQHEQAATRLNGTKKAAAGLRSATASLFHTATTRRSGENLRRSA